MKTKQNRPKFLNLLQIHLPVTGVNSIAHRISGALMSLAIPGLIYLFGLTIKDAASFDRFVTISASTPFKVVLTLLAWSLAHHVLSGIRFLLADINIGMSLVAARWLAWLANIGGVVILIGLGCVIWL